MDIGQGLSRNTYDLIVEHIHIAARTVFDILCQKAIKKEKEENVKNGRSPMNLKISGDGSWKKRGFTSLHGVTTLIGYYSGKVIDLIVKGSYYQACTFWSKKKILKNMLNVCGMKRTCRTMRLKSYRFCG